MGLNIFPVQKDNFLSQFDYDLFVIGAGSGGVRAARMAADKGLSVGIAEERFLGGTCVNVGCVPKKLFVIASQFPSKFKLSESFGWQTATNLSFSWEILKQNKDKEIARLNKIYDGLISNSGAKLYHDSASFLDEHTLNIGDKKITAEKILIATGGHSRQPIFRGNEHVVHSDDMFAIENLPKELLIIGGGYIAIEFACLMNKLGVHVILINRSQEILRGFDREMVGKITQSMIAQGIDLQLNDEISNIEKVNGSLSIQTKNGSHIRTDMVLSAIGRSPNLANLKIENIGLKLNKYGAVEVNQHYETNVGNVYALGDVIDRYQLTPVAISEAMVLVENLIGARKTFDYENIPTAIFSSPEFATVGLSEEVARQKFNEIDIFVSSFNSLSTSLSDQKSQITVKLIVKKTDNKVVGCHMVGDHAAEIIQGMAVAIKAGATKEVFDNTVGIHPSTAEEFVTLRSVTR